MLKSFQRKFLSYLCVGQKTFFTIQTYSTGKKNASKGHLEATSIIGHTLLMSLLSPISSRMGATSTVVSGSSYFRILAGSQRNLRYGSTDVIGTCEVASKWPPSGLYLHFFDRYCTASCTLIACYFLQFSVLSHSKVYR